MNSKILNLHYSPDSTDAGGAAVADVATLPSSTTSIESFLSSIDDGSIADGVDTSTGPTEVLGNKDGTPAVEPQTEAAKFVNNAPTVPSVHNQRASTRQIKPAPAPSTVERDLTGFNPEDAALLKQMSNPAFDWTKAKLAELKQISEAKAARDAEVETLKNSSNRWLYEHEEAYKLSPEYKEHSAQVNIYAGEFGHWQRQLSRAQAGQPVYDVSLDKNGNLVQGTDPIESTPDVIAQIHANMVAASSAKQDATNKLQSWQSTHKQRFQQVRSRLTGLEQQLFPNGVSEPIKAQISDAMKAFPLELHSDPAYRALGTASVLVKAMNARITELESQLNGKSALRAVEAKQGIADPNPASRAARASRTVADELERLEAVRD